MLNKLTFTEFRHSKYAPPRFIEGTSIIFTFDEWWNMCKKLYIKYRAKRIKQIKKLRF